MMLNDDIPRAPMDVEFERWCGDRVGVLPDPKLWRAIQKAKRSFKMGHTVMIHRTHLGGTKFLVEIGVHKDE